MCGRTTEHWSELFGKGRDICATFISQSNGLCTHTHTHKHYVNLCETFHRHGAFARFWSHRHLAPTLIPSLKTRPLPSNCPLIWWGPKGPKNCPHFSSRMIIFGTQCVATTRTHTHTQTHTHTHTHRGLSNPTPVTARVPTVKTAPILPPTTTLVPPPFSLDSSLTYQTLFVSTYFYPPLLN